MTHRLLYLGRPLFKIASHRMEPSPVCSHTLSVQQSRVSNLGYVTQCVSYRDPTGEVCMFLHDNSPATWCTKETPTPNTHAQRSNSCDDPHDVLGGCWSIAI